MMASHPSDDQTISEGDYVYQTTGIFSPEAQGIVVAVQDGSIPDIPQNQQNWILVAKYSNEPFMASDISTGVGGTSGMMYSVADVGGFTGWYLEEPSTVTTEDYDGLTFDFKPLMIKEFHRKITR